MKKLISSNAKFGVHGGKKLNSIHHGHNHNIRIVCIKCKCNTIILHWIRLAAVLWAKETLPPGNHATIIPDTLHACTHFCYGAVLLIYLHNRSKFDS